jgi:hypothetical protein
VAEATQRTEVLSESRVFTHKGWPYRVALVASLVTVLAGFAMPASASGPMDGSIPHGFLFLGISVFFPLICFVALVVPGRRRLLRQAVVVIAGVGTCAVGVLWMLLVGPRYPSFLSNAFGASVTGVVFGAILSATAALVMIIADAISWRHGAEKRDLAQRV